MNPADEAADNWLQWGLTPYQSHPFNQRWKITMSKKFILDPGCPVMLNCATAGVHKLMVGMDTSQPVFPAGEQTNIPFYQRGLTKCILFHWHGIPVSNDLNTIVSLSESALDFVWSHKISVMSSFGQTRNLLSTNNALDRTTQMQLFSDVVDVKVED